jgi:tetratricopeptide (TPR) repeat protein
LAITVAAAVIAVTAVAVLFFMRPAADTAPAPPGAVVDERPAAAPAPDHAVAPVVTSMDAARGAAAASGRGDVAGAVEQFTVAVTADPRNADALNNLGQSLVRAGRGREAIPYFDRAIATSGSVWAYHFNRARAYAELQEWNRAIAGYRDALGLFPDDYATTFNLAKALQANGNLSDAILQFERAIALAPGQGDFYLAYALALESAQRPGEAVAVYRRFLELQPADPQAEKIKARIAQLEPAVR